MPFDTYVVLTLVLAAARAAVLTVPARVLLFRRRHDERANQLGHPSGVARRKVLPNTQSCDEVVALKA